ncbi:MAG: 2Fe-2S iron-sulfur cluster binding domain-containing protein [Rubrobacteridae bacterium]|nr:2Fe-2S iron-sulfur cluster binding domain-containing protein [Rubrobacteridae bacterium]
MAKVHFYPDDKIIEVQNGENLLRAALLAGVHINASCGGSGTCGKCRVVIDDKTNVDVEESSKLSAGDVEKGYVLACKTVVNGDVEVRVPVESQMGDSRAALEREHREVSHGSVMSTKDLSELFGEFDLNPSTRRYYIEMPEPNLEDNLSDLERLKRELTKAYGISDFTVDLNCLRKMAVGLREAGWKITVTMIEGGEGECPRLIRIDSGDRSGKYYGLAVDIGTTSIYVEPGTRFRI